MNGKVSRNQIQTQTHGNRLNTSNLFAFDRQSPFDGETISKALDEDSKNATAAVKNRKAVADICSKESKTEAEQTGCQEHADAYHRLAEGKNAIRDSFAEFRSWNPDLTYPRNTFFGIIKKQPEISKEARTIALDLSANEDLKWLDYGIEYPFAGATDLITFGYTDKLGALKNDWDSFASDAGFEKALDKAEDYEAGMIDAKYAEKLTGHKAEDSDWAVGGP